MSHKNVSIGLKISSNIKFMKGHCDRQADPVGSHLESTSNYHRDYCRDRNF